MHSTCVLLRNLRGKFKFNLGGQKYNSEVAVSQTLTNYRNELEVEVLVIPTDNAEEIQLS